MAILSQVNPSYWRTQEPETHRRYPTLQGELKADVAVVGAGITGLTAAYRLQEVGARVAVVDLHRVGQGTTGHSTGHLDVVPDLSFQSLIRRFGRRKARIALEARTAAIDRIEQWDRQLNLNSQLRRIPAYLYCESQNEIRTLEKELHAAQRLNVRAEMRNCAPLPFDNEQAIRFPNQARFSPLHYVRGLADAFVQRGGRIYENTRAENIEPRDSRVDLATNHGMITADRVVLAGHGPMLGLFSTESRTYPYQSYVLTVRVADDLADALYWDVADPYHYTRLASDDDPQLLIVGGADHPTGEMPDNNAPFAELERYVYERFEVQAIEGRWLHEFWESADGLPYIGPVPGIDNVYIGTGYSGEGLTNGTVAGLLIADQILGRKTPWSSVFDPARLNLTGSAIDLVSGALHIGKHFVGDRLQRDEADSPQAVPAGEGRLVTVQGQRRAVFRDDAGQLHVMSPVCRHRGCFVQWNNTDKTWDCPCHGGRYDAYGNVITGPPKEPLQPRDLPEEEQRSRRLA